jgi:hypothetical protein
MNKVCGSTSSITKLSHLLLYLQLLFLIKIHTSLCVFKNLHNLTSSHCFKLPENFGFNSNFLTQKPKLQNHRHQTCNMETISELSKSDLQYHNLPPGWILTILVLQDTSSIYVYYADLYVVLYTYTHLKPTPGKIKHYSKQTTLDVTIGKI